MGLRKPVDDDAVLGILRRLRTLDVAMHDCIRAQAPEGLGLQHMLTIRTLVTEGAMPQGRLAERLGLSKGGASQIVSRLEAQGLVERRRDADDARVQWVHITEATAALRDGMEARLTATFRDLFQGWTDGDARRMEGLLDALTARAKATRLEAPDGRLQVPGALNPP